MIADARRSRNLSQKELATRVGVSRSTVAMWEMGESNPRASLLPKIADVLGCTIDELLRGGERKEKE